MYAMRLKAVLLVLGLAMGLLAAGLFQLQVVEGSRYRLEAQHRLRSTPGFYPTMRGHIYDRNGVALAQDAGAFDVAIYYPFLELDNAFVAKMARQWGVSADEFRRRMDRMWPALSRLTGVPETELAAKVQTILERVEDIRQSVAQRLGRKEPVREATYGESTSIAHTLVPDIDLQTYGAISSRPEDFPGVVILPTRKREYLLVSQNPPRVAAPHIIGSLGEVTREELQGRLNDPYPPGNLKRYAPGDDIGRGGIESACEEWLRGSRGLFQKGIEGDFLEDIDPQPGRDVHLTLDIALQADIEMLLDRPPADVGIPRIEGAAVVIDCRTGEVLALVTAPRFNPMTLAADFAALERDASAPLYNRALRGKYPLGSVFKAVTTLAGLSEGVLTPQTRFTCEGALDPRRRDRFKCDVASGHGTIDLRAAIKESCNVYFYHVAESLSRDPDGERNLALGSERLQAYGKRLGLGRPTGIGLAELTGSLEESEPRNLAIGQGAMYVSPIQVAQLYGLVATDGRMPPLQLIRERPAGARPDLGLDPRYLALLRDGLRAVVNETGGTAHSTVYLPDIAIAGKTGTAQPGGPNSTPHAWFAGYAPADNPRIAFAVIVEHGGHGGKAAGPIAREIVRKCQAFGYLGDRAPAAPAGAKAPKMPPPPPAPPAAPPQPVG
jgi:penicillin-binding protein 2